MNQDSLIPKALVTDCVSNFSALKTRIISHYNIGCPIRKEWELWFTENEPKSIYVEEYIEWQKYSSPLNQYFWTNISHVPQWEPSVPVTSSTIFPSYVVVALPTVQCQFDRNNSFPAFKEMDTHQPTGADGREAVAQTPHSR